MTVSSGRNIVWPEVYARLPWVTRLKKPHTCTSRARNKPCKNSARWKYEGLKATPRFPWRWDTSGTYCWSHLYSRGIWGSMEEEHRNLKWWKKHDPEIYEIVRPRWPGMTDNDE
jgi:hypothetical protein